MEECRISEIAKELAEQLESSRLPDDFAPLEGYRQTILYVRYQHTNYEDLMHKLYEACVNFQDRYGCEYCDEATVGWASCTLLTQGHHMLRHAADDEARRLHN